MTSKPSFPLTLAAAIAVSACAVSFGKPTGACDSHRRGARLVTRSVVVYGSRIPPSDTTIYYACLRPSGRSLDLGVDEEGGLYGSDATTNGFASAGTYVLAQSSTGAASLAVCARYNSTRRCAPDQHLLTVANLATGRQARVPIYARLPVPALVPFPVTAAVSRVGAVAWLQNRMTGASVRTGLQLWATVLEARGRSTLEATPSMLDAGCQGRSKTRPLTPVEN